MSDLKNEPVLIMAFVQATIALVVSFGLHLTPEQIGAIMAFAAAALALVVRQQVTPNSQVTATTPDALNPKP